MLGINELDLVLRSLGHVSTCVVAYVVYIYYCMYCVHTTVLVGHDCESRDCNQIMNSMYRHLTVAQL